MMMKYTHIYASSHSYLLCAHFCLTRLAAIRKKREEDAARRSLEGRAPGWTANGVDSSDDSSDDGSDDGKAKPAAKSALAAPPAVPSEKESIAAKKKAAAAAVVADEAEDAEVRYVTVSTMHADTD